MSRHLLFILAIGTLSIAGITFAAVQYFSYSTGYSLTFGTFYTNGSGNAGKVYIGESNPDGYSSTARLDGTILTGTIWLQAAGVATFNPDAQIVPPASGPASLSGWTVVGTMTSPNIGTIYLSGSNTALSFNPITQKLEGYGWNVGVGKVWFGESISSIIGTGTGAGFLGRVKIIGNAGGTTIYDTLYFQGVKFNANMFNTALQRVRKNVGLLSRNIGSTYTNNSFPLSPKALDTKIFYINNGTTSKVVRYSSGDLSSQFGGNIQSLIIIGGDLILDKEQIGSNMVGVPPKGIIVLKNDNGIGGNIYIAGNVENIQSSIFAEGTIYSGDDSTSLYNDTMTGITMLPETQLWIRGSFISRNTIGGAAQSSAPVCPFNASVPCSYETSIKYDLNYFRDYRKDPTKRAYVASDAYEDYSVILEYDPRVLSNPPPGLE